MARSCDEAIRELKKSNAEVELDQVEMTVTVEADIDDAALRAPARPGASVIPGLRLDLKSKLVPKATTTTTSTRPGTTTSRTGTATTPTASTAADDDEVTGKIELRLLLSRKD